jgi:hypothetical protein
VVAVFTLRNVGGVALLLFGTTFMWLTPEFASRGVSTSSAWWAVTRVLALVTLLGFTVATWGLFQRSDWWDTVAIGSAVLGLVTVVPYLIAAVRAGENTPWFTALISVSGSVAVLTLLLVPALARWVNGHVMSP